MTLTEAREKANAARFGSQEWEEAMIAVRALVESENAATDFGYHESVDGDVLSA